MAAYSFGQEINVPAVMSEIQGGVPSIIPDGTALTVEFENEGTVPVTLVFTGSSNSI